MPEGLHLPGAATLIQASYFVAAALFILGLKRMSSPVTARGGIVWAGLGMLVATLITFLSPQMHNYALMTVAIAIGGVIAWVSGKRVAMTDMPQMIALYNGMGGGAAGAIDRVWVDDGDLRFHVLGDGPPQGICGSGLIDAVAAALDLGLIDWTGLIQIERRDRFAPALAARLAERGEERLLILAPRGGASGGGEIVLTQDDVRQVQLAKGAIGGGIRMLQHVLGVPDEALTDLMLAGGFGNYLSIRSAVRIGLIPPLPAERIRYVGNAAALGAQLALVSETERARADRLARSIEHLSLATHPDFQDLFVEAMNFPQA